LYLIHFDLFRFAFEKPAIDPDLLAAVVSQSNESKTILIQKIRMKIAGQTSFWMKWSEIDGPEMESAVVYLNRF